MKLILICLCAVIVILLAGLLTTEGYLVYVDPQRDNTTITLRDSMLHFLRSLWNLLQPVLQLALTLAVVLFFLNRSGITMRISERQASSDGLNTQSIIALIVIGSFAVATFTRTETAAQLKEIALVVVGFYFGSKQNRDQRNEPGEGAGAGAAGAAATNGSGGTLSAASSTVGAATPPPAPPG